MRTAELAEALGVTEPTIRKDISDLAEQELLRRTHGGAICVRPLREPDVDTRRSQNTEQKTAIARACLHLISDGDAVFIDSGTTLQRLAELLAHPDESLGTIPPRNVNVLTNALPVAQTLADVSGVRHTTLGGTFRPAGQSFVGPLAMAALEQFTVNVAFLGVTGISDGRLTVADPAEAQLKRAVMERARQVVVAMDSSKLGASDYAYVCSLDAVHTLVTDQENSYLAGLCQAHSVKLVVSSSPRR